MPWLLRDDQVLAALEVATARRDRMRGLLGRDGIDGALLLEPGKSVHSVGMRFPIDVAFCDKQLVVLRTVRLRPNRVTRPSLRCQCIIEAEAGAFERWKLRPGDQLEVRE
ncbi:MAG: DUF192 domain-containing protein [Acidimicrobiia bacterium]